ncbi:MAG: hypothetical protein QF491_14500, partial [Alphaproteobacteria bacterium]|nr:hypothetical protein [Alphaproteobacteria bacterium]
MKPDHRRTKLLHRADTAVVGIIRMTRRALAMTRGAFPSACESGRSAIAGASALAGQWKRRPPSSMG